jgi:hypothetical protein
MFYLQNCTDEPSPPDATGMKPVFALQFAMTEQDVNHSLIINRLKRTTARPCQSSAGVAVRRASEECEGFEC